MATAALVGIMTDTGSFQFPSHRRARARARGEAARSGRRPAGDHLQRLPQQALPGAEALGLRVLAKMRREQDGQLVWTEVTRGDFESAEALDEDISGLVEQIARANGMRVALLFNEHDAGAIKVSCRTSAWAPSVDASAVMARFGGGGHVRAAGALIKGSATEVREARPRCRARGARGRTRRRARRRRDRLTRRRGAA